MKVSVFEPIYFSKQKRKTLGGDRGICEFTKAKIYLGGDSLLHSSSQIYFQGGKKPSKGKEVDESKGKGTKPPNAPSTQDAKTKEKGYKGRSKLSPKEME